MRQRTRRSMPVLLLMGCWACGPSGTDTDTAWKGSMDTLPSGQIVVTNPHAPMWPASGGWHLVEDLRIGTVEGTGPDLFGQIRSLAVDAAGRIYVLESQAQEIRVFRPDGTHLRTIGRKGGGPGELAQAVLAEFGPDGNLWVVDPQNNRLSVFDTAGTYVTSHRMPGGFVIIPWPGGFDVQGDYYAPVPEPSDEGFRIGIAHFDSSLQVVDTLTWPQDPVERDHFEAHSNEGGWSVMMASVPFSAGFVTRLSPRGTLWGMFTGEYRLFELSHSGDTLLTITRAFDPLPVTAADRDQAREDLKWFTQQGGKADWSKIPSAKPATEQMTFDDAGNVWVWVVGSTEQKDRLLDVFDSAGRYLGRVTSPIPISQNTNPVFRNGVMYAVTKNDLEVPFVVRLRIEKP